MAEEAGSQIGDAFVSIGGSRENLQAALKAATKDVADWVTRSSAALSNIRAPGGPGGGGLGGPGGGVGAEGGDGGSILDFLFGGAAGAVVAKKGILGKILKKGLARLGGYISVAVGALDFAGMKKESEQLGIAIGRLGGDAVKNFSDAIDAVMKTRAVTGGFGGGSELGAAVPYREAIRAQTILAQAGVKPDERLLQQIAGHASATGKSLEEVAAIFTQLRQGAGDIQGLALRIPETATGPERVAAFQKQGDRLFKILQTRTTTFTGRLERLGTFLKEGIPHTAASIESIFHDFHKSGRNLAEQFSREETKRTGMTPEQRERRGLDPAAMRNPDFDPTLNQGRIPQRDRLVEDIASMKDRRTEMINLIHAERASGSEPVELVNQMVHLHVSILNLAEKIEQMSDDPVPTASTDDVEIGKNRR